MRQQRKDLEVQNGIMDPTTRRNARSNKCIASRFGKMSILVENGDFWNVFVEKDMVCICLHMFA